jgi:hypothetical protein
MTRNRTLVTLALFVAACVVASQVRASNVISADFMYNDTGVGPITGDTTLAPGPQSNADGLIYTGQNVIWNAVVTGSNNGNSNSAAAGPLHNGDGNPTSVNFTMTADDSWRGNLTTTNIPLLRSQTPALDGDFPNAESAYLYNGVLTGDHLNWTLSGLTPNGTYNFTFFGDGSVPGGTTHTANGVSGVLDSEGDWNWANLHADALGNIAGLFTDPNPTSGLVGFQLQPAGAPTPEPASLLLAGFGLAGVVIAVRRTRRVA